MGDKHGIGTLVNEQHEMATDSIDLFSLPSIETSQIHGKTLEFHLSSVLTNNGPFEYIIPSDSNEFTYMPLTRIEGEIEVQKTDGTALAATDAQSIVNLFPHSLFRQMEFYINDVQINDLSTPTYPYKAFIEDHLTYDQDVKDTSLLACEWYIKDTVGQEEKFTLDDHAKSFKTRQALIAGKKVRFSIVPHIDFLQCKRYLLPGCDLKLKILRSTDSFSLLGDALIAKIKINKLRMKIRRITLDPSIAAAIEDRLSRTPAIYPIVQSKIKAYLINKDIQTQTITQIFRGKIPRSFILCFVDAKGYDGHIDKNPFFFQHFDNNYLNVFLNGEPIVPNVFQPNFSTGDCIGEYRWLLDNIGLYQTMSNGITFQEFVSNSMFYAFDLSPDLCNSYYLHGSETGTLDVHVGFSKPLPQNIMCIIYASFDEAILIDKDRNVTLT